MDGARDRSAGCAKCSHRGYSIGPGKNGCGRAEVCECLSACPECGGSAAVFVKNDRGYTCLGPCGLCGAVRLRVRRYNNARIPSKYHGVFRVDAMNPSDAEQIRAMSYVKSFVDRYPRENGFLLMGAPGLGKTLLAVGAIAELTLQKAVDCVFTDFFFLLGDLRNAYSEGVSENEIIEPLTSAEVLVIDEMGKGRSSEWERGILDQLISRRYNSSKKTLVTTNYVAREFLSANSGTGTEVLEDRVGERIASRLYEMCEPLLLTGSDYRKRGIPV